MCWSFWREKIDRPQLATRRDTVAGWQIFARTCESAGRDRPPILFVHGLAMSSRYMIPTARELALDFRVYAPDLPGFGKSEKTRRALSLPELAQVLRAWLDHAGLDQVVLLGNSMGCNIIANFVLQNPGRALAAVMVGPTMDPRIRSMPSAFLHGLWNMAYEPVSFYPVLVQDYLAYGIRRTVTSLREAAREPITKKLERLELPVLVVRGQRDKLCSQDWCYQVAGRLPHGRMVEIPGAAHVVNFDSPGPLGGWVRKFLQSQNMFK